LGFTDYNTYAENMRSRDIQKKEPRPIRVLALGGRTILNPAREQQQQQLRASSFRSCKLEKLRNLAVH